jgi:hypothetical protein
MSNIDDRYKVQSQKRPINRRLSLPNCDTDLVGLTENFTDNSKSINKIMNTKPSYLSQFDMQTFDSNGDPSAPNDIYKS